MIVKDVVSRPFDQDRTADNLMPAWMHENSDCM